MIYTTHGGTYEADSARELVSQMRESHFVEYRNDKDYMAAQAKMSQEMTGIAHRSDTAEHFLDDMIASGLVKMEKGESDDEEATTKGS
jgi:hypothetical protein